MNLHTKALEFVNPLKVLTLDTLPTKTEVPTDSIFMLLCLLLQACSVASTATIGHFMSPQMLD